MQNSFNWLASGDVCEINQHVVKNSGEPYSLLDIGKLEGALSRPYSAWAYNSEENVIVLGVEYMVSIAGAHAFLQGNKRTGFIAGRTFMQFHGYDFHVPDTEATAKLFTDVIAHKLDFTSFYTHLEQHIVPFDE